DQTPEAQPANGTSIETADATELAKVVRISDYLDAIAKGRPLPIFDVSEFAFAEAGEAAFQQAMRMPPAALAVSGGGLGSTGPGNLPGAAATPPTANDNQPAPGSPPAGGNPVGPDMPGSPPGDDGPGFGSPGGSEPGPGDRAVDDDDDDEDDVPEARLNRRPVLSGPVFLDNGLVNLSVIITMGELLHGASDPDGDTLIVRNLEVDGGHLERIGLDRWLYTPATDAAGAVVFRYQVSDGDELVMQTAHLEIRLPENQA
ncbi:MAG: cadherin-like domain-containing protein, partial [Aurantimonas endophytica]|uniref:cadherin-like domain-containing protein n=1 Tax=Aurantimonas endophytica TaxID=1522175 RepID=UPI00300181AD